MDYKYKHNFFNPNNKDSWDDLNKEIDKINRAGHTHIYIDDSNNMIIEDPGRTLKKSLAWYEGMDINMLSGLLYRECGNV